MAIAVPHRDEFSETVAFLISGPSRKILWLPDIDKWEKWTTPIESMIARVDVAYIDATFYDERELPGRNLSEIPHPTITETMQRLAALPAAERSPMMELAIRDGLEHGQKLDPRRAVPLHLPREIWLVAALIWFFTVAFDPKLPPRIAAWAKRIEAQPYFDKTFPPHWK